MVLVVADDRYGGLLDDVGIELGPAERSGRERAIGVSQGCGDEDVRVGDDAQHQAAVSRSARAASSSCAIARAWSSSRSERSRTDLCEERAEVVGADRAIDDLAFAEVRLGSVSAKDRSDFCVEVDARLLPGGHWIKGYRPARGAQRRQCRKASIHSAPSGRGTGSGRSRIGTACL
jgi:hypothetical protein